MLALLAVVHTRVAAAKQPDLLDRLLRLEADHSALCEGMQDSDVTRNQLSEAVGVLRGGLPDFLLKVGRPAEPTLSINDASRLIAALNGLVFSHLGIRPSQHLHDPCNVFLSSVLARKQGYCVGIAAVYLVLAEELDLPIRSAATPSHVFLRYDDGIHGINIETFQNGAAVPDAHYIAEQKIAPTSIRKGIFLRGLTSDQFLAQVHNNLGVIYSQRGDFEQAATEYGEALGFAPRFPAAWYNWGNDLQRQGDLDGAVRYLSKGLRLHPNDVWALNNRGLVYMKLGKREKARTDFEAAVRIDPAFEQARKNLQSIE